MRGQIANARIQRASQQYIPPPDEDQDDDQYTTSMPRSAIRYPVGKPYTIQQGNRRIVFHPEPPPKRSKHWLVYIGIGMIAMLDIFFGLQILGNLWCELYLKEIYGIPRTYQVDLDD